MSMDAFDDLILSGDWVTLTAVDSSDSLKKRLSDFGFVPGTRMRCCWLSPWKDVAALEFRNTLLAVRTRDLAGIRVCAL